jgi:hypothetical protein
LFHFKTFSQRLHPALLVLKPIQTVCLTVGFLKSILANTNKKFYFNQSKIALTKPFRFPNKQVDKDFKKKIQSSVLVQQVVWQALICCWTKDKFLKHNMELFTKTLKMLILFDTKIYFYEFIIWEESKKLRFRYSQA